jgi:hypothetical protein
MGNCSNCWTPRKHFEDVDGHTQPVSNMQKRHSEIYSDFDLGSNASISLLTDNHLITQEQRDEEEEEVKVRPGMMSDHIKFTLLEINLARTYERIIKEPFGFLIKICHNGAEYRTEEYTAIDNHTYINLDFNFNLLNTSTIVTLQLLAHRKDFTTEIGYATFDTDSVSSYQKFRGHIPLYYRGMKIALVLCELAKFSSDMSYDYMTLGSPIKEATRVTYLPSKDYPIPLSNLNTSTPKFLSKSSFASDNKPGNIAYTDVVAVIDMIKDVKTGINELVELLDKDYPEIIYHTCERLKYFASQQSYAHTIAANKFSRLCEILNNYYKDSLVILQLLWVLFRLSEQSVFVRCIADSC